MPEQSDSDKGGKEYENFPAKKPLIWYERRFTKHGTQQRSRNGLGRPTLFGLAALARMTQSLRRHGLTRVQIRNEPSNRRFSCVIGRLLSGWTLAMLSLLSKDLGVILRFERQRTNQDAVEDNASRRELEWFAQFHRRPLKRRSTAGGLEVE